MIRLCESKWSAMLQLCEGKYANGVPCNVRVRRTNVSTLQAEQTSHAHDHTHDHSVTQQPTHPIARIDRRRAIPHLARHIPRAAAPEPDLDERIRALHRVPAAARAVERRAEAVRAWRAHAAPRVVRRARVAVVPRARAVVDGNIF